MRSMILVCAMLVGCSGQEAAPRRPPPTKQDAEAALSRTPIPRTYRIDGNQLQVIEVPVRVGSRWVDHQRCYVWRDSEYRTVSLQCPSDTGSFDLMPPGAAPGDEGSRP